jgi:hypothetical protein
MLQSKMVVVAWLCKTMTKKTHYDCFVVCSDDSVYNSDYGMICDCGHWTFGDDDFHVPIRRDYREAYVK